jgi:D-beta-D-heptose 7-phosphate kinase/D-beta-D-heptose 1-phosphate adenosyltransferase
MKNVEFVNTKILSFKEIAHRVKQWRVLGRKVAFTNGVFDILHPGHIYSLSQAAREADYLVVGLNSDASVKRLKGESRPVNNQDARALVLASLAIIDAVVVFEQDTPLQLIMEVMPDVLVKGGDYTLEQIVGAREVIASGGKVVINPILEGFSTTGLINQIRR